jgi:hypothetical protein
MRRALTQILGSRGLEISGSLGTAPLALASTSQSLSAHDASYWLLQRRQSSSGSSGSGNATTDSQWCATASLPSLSACARSLGDVFNPSLPTNHYFVTYIIHIWKEMPEISLPAPQDRSEKVGPTSQPLQEQVSPLCAGGCARRPGIRGDLGTGGIRSQEQVLRVRMGTVCGMKKE